MYTHKKFKSFLTKAQVSIGNMNNQYTPNLIRKLVYWFLRRVGDGGGDGEWHLWLYPWYKYVLGMGGILEWLCLFVHLSMSLCLIESAQYLLNCSTVFCLFVCLFVFNQTWYDCVLSWGIVSCGKIGSLSSMSRSQQGLIYNQNTTIVTLSLKLLVCLQPNLVW